MLVFNSFSAENSLLIVIPNKYFYNYLYDYARKTTEIQQQHKPQNPKKYMNDSDNIIYRSMKRRCMKYFDTT